VNDRRGEGWYYQIGYKEKITEKLEGNEIRTFECELQAIYEELLFSLYYDSSSSDEDASGAYPYPYSYDEPFSGGVIIRLIPDSHSEYWEE